MLKLNRFKKSTVMLLGIIIIIIGVFFGLNEFIERKKNKAFSEMNIKLYENEQPEIIDSSEQKDEVTNNEEIDSTEEEIINNIEEPEENQNEVPNVNYNYEGILEIPKINLKRGFYNIGSRYNSVSYNVTVINGSTFPDQSNNNLILAAHSGNCSICYFDKLYKLELNDTAYIYYKDVKYTYKIVNIYYVEKNGTVAIYRNYNKKTLTLITCTRGSDTKQTVYILEQTS